jgi:hypothetical protein
MAVVELDPAPGPARWLLLIHQLPAKPAYLRVKIWRRLQALGAVTVKNSVYALPASERTQEDLEWVLKEVLGGGGEGMICEARIVDGLSDDEIRGLFNAAREQDYAALTTDLRALTEALEGNETQSARNEARAKLSRIRANLLQITEIDHFGANGREVVEGLLRAVDEQLRDDETPEQPGGEVMDPGIYTLKARVWVTRERVFVDRIASAWLIRRFIDPQARFKFVLGRGYVPEPGELRFDMFEGEFTHDGDRCTFEVLLTRAGLNDPALTAIGEIIHDIDLKDAKFGRAEVDGIARLIEGLSIACKDDAQRIERGAAMFDDLYESLRARE